MNRILSRLGDVSASLAVALMLCSAATGCGSSGPPMAYVSGKVTYKGQPVPMGLVAFYPTSPEGRNATGNITADGSYTIQTETPGDGAILGDYKVAITARDEVILDHIPRKPIPPKRLAPAKYEDPNTSGLTVKIESGSNTKNFELTD